MSAVIVAEHYHKFEGLPVVVCVLEIEDGFMAVGHSATSQYKFQKTAEEAYARANAFAMLNRVWKPKTSPAK